MKVRGLSGCATLANGAARPAVRRFRSVKGAIDLLGQFPRDAVDTGKVFGTRGRNATQSAEALVEKADSFIAYVAARQQRPVLCFYLHPWEIDPAQPRIPGASRLSRFRHYVNLAQNERKLDVLLRRMPFARLCDVVGQQPAAEASGTSPPVQRDRAPTASAEVA